MRTVLVIGIGAGNPDHLTLQAVAAMRRAEVVFLIDKGAAKDDLTGLRTELLDRHVGAGRYRLVEAPDPDRDRTAEGTAYRDAVADWQDRRAAIYARMIADELGPDGTGAFLVWGDPSLYDGTLRLLAGIREADLAAGGSGFDVDIYWGAYLGTADEVLVSGNLAKVKDEIVALRAQRRAAKGWIMDTYLLRRNPGRR